MKHRIQQRHLKHEGFTTKEAQLFVGSPGAALVPIGQAKVVIMVQHRHEIVRCSCGAVIAQCRCLGPKEEQVVAGACDDCQARRKN